MNKNGIILTLGVLLLIFSVFNMRGEKAVEQETVETPTVTVAPTITPVQGYMGVFRDEYMRGCDTTGENAKYCSCTLDYLIQTYGEDRVLDIAVDYAKTEEISDEMLESAVYCSEFYKSSRVN